MSISMYKLEELEFDIKVLVSLKDKEQNTYYSYIEIDRDMLERFMEDTTFVGKPTEFEIKKEIEMHADSVFDVMTSIHKNKPTDLVTEIEDDYGDVVDIDVNELEWDWIFSVDIFNLKYRLEDYVFPWEGRRQAYMEKLLLDMED